MIEAPIRGSAIRGRYRVAVPVRFVHVLLALFAVAPSPAVATAGAQGAVSGQVTILERGARRTDDLANAVVHLEPVSGRATAPPPTTSAMALQGRQFSPRVRVVPEGSRIAFPNQDPFSHNVFSKAANGPFDTESYGRGKTRDQTFRTAGIYPLYCNVHPRMTAFVLALRTPWYAQAGGDGRFEVAGVPAGSYRLHVWHDRAAAHVADVVVPAVGVAGLRIELDARNHQVVQHRNKYGKEYPASSDLY